ncbi:MAG: BlaI/MecI/CopY family transcriptional regulator [Dysgonamonadaceae bacterium]|nr:BlaI/MecI/CopY family transcriptional regulator [Dysgonamonadaceae bacterium]MDD4727170.1 BlaI/MecI/CopY family transcriptional regulator [Dysgonamonadaceae bacterium]
MEPLTPQEETVMLLVWELEKCAIKDVVDKMDDPKPPYTTVASIFNNLERKNYLSMRKYGNVKVYSPKITEAAYKRHFLSDLVKSYFDDSYKELVSFFAKEQKITTEELTEIIELIEKNRK